MGLALTAVRLRSTLEVTSNFTGETLTNLRGSQAQAFLLHFAHRFFGLHKVGLTVNR